MKSGSLASSKVDKAGEPVLSTQSTQYTLIKEDTLSYRGLNVMV